MINACLNHWGQQLTYYSSQFIAESSWDCWASIWLTALPIAEHGIALHKWAFRDVLCLRYGWRAPLLPSQCVCDENFIMEHALSCPYGVDNTSQRSKKHHCLSYEWCLPRCLDWADITKLHHNTANTEDGTHVDIKAQGFWKTRASVHFFDRVFNPHAHIYRSLLLSTCYGRHDKKRRWPVIREAEHGCLSCGLQEVGINDRHETQSYSRCRLSFHSSIMCLTTLVWSAGFRIISNRLV